MEYLIENQKYLQTFNCSLAINKDKNICGLVIRQDGKEIFIKEGGLLHIIGNVKNCSELSNKELTIKDLFKIINEVFKPIIK